jgi:hypothetical protein
VFICDFFFFFRCVLTGVFGELELRNHLEMTLIRGFIQFEFFHFLKRLFFPILLPLMDLIFIPYCFAKSAGMLMDSYLYRTMMIRYCIHIYICLRVLWYVVFTSFQYAINLHNEIRDNRYLLATELTNRAEIKHS